MYINSKSKWRNCNSEAQAMKHQQVDITSVLQFFTQVVMVTKICGICFLNLTDYFKQIKLYHIS